MGDSQYNDLLRTTMMKLADTASHPTAIDLTLQSATEACVELLPGSHSADVLIITGGKDYESMAATSSLVEVLDAAQKRYGEGPCVNAARGETVVRCDDLQNDARWPLFAKAAVAQGVRSMISFQLFTHDDRVAALNVAGAEPNCFGPEAEALGAMLATHCAIALIADGKQLEFKSALASRDLIGQAKGIIMERFDVDAVRAFELLRQLSQGSNTKLSVVAAGIVADQSSRRPP